MSSEKPTVQPLYRMADPTAPAHLERPESAGFDPATDEEILAQPCVVAALTAERGADPETGEHFKFALEQSEDGRWLFSLCKYVNGKLLAGFCEDSAEKMHRAIVRSGWAVDKAEGS